MKLPLKATVVPYSSIVGQSLMLTDQDGRAVAHVGLLSVIPPGEDVTPENYKAHAAEIADLLASIINGGAA